uniref:Putative ribonuclease H-like domain-containing protein n=1 Tax=Tanacetum cinerariifolium TaxID=118510 RepID=A0A699KI90_TANCI|nr:putative ribonuclease H-like domain-containing protein [Tanacetum cinerariifolium]GFA91440.1 putative ribonuclease H-like domain-containing protein [Tanacetum cinerariifolium]
MFATMNCDFLKTKYFYSPQHSGQEEEQCDTLSWLGYTSKESCLNHNTTSAGAQEQSSLNISATEDTIPNLISEVSNSQPSDSLDEILENIHETVGVQEHEEPTLTENNDMDVEMDALMRNGTWDKCILPHWKKHVGCRWIFTIRYKPDGTVERYKSRLVAKGYIQTYGIDYSETFSPVAKIDTIRVLFSITANQGPAWILSAFQEFFKLKKSLYGLKQSPRAWFGRFTLAMKKYGYKQSNSYHTLFLRHRGDRVTCLIIYVDDMIITGNDESKIKKLKEGLCAEFKMKDLGNLSYFLGIEVMISPQGIFIC